jgi:hypothetical protein
MHLRADGLQGFFPCKRFVNPPSRRVAPDKACPYIPFGSLTNINYAPVDMARRASDAVLRRISRHAGRQPPFRRRARWSFAFHCFSGSPRSGG